jgi:hypothetical protein
LLAIHRASEAVLRIHYRAVFKARLWQRYGYEHTVRSVEAAISVARYILENPVRAGLVVSIEDYPFSGSSEYTVEQIIEAAQLRKTGTAGPAKAGHYTAVRLKPDATLRF